MAKNTQSSGPILFPTLSFDQLINPGSDTNQTPTRKQKLRVVSAEVGNSAGANVSAGWGFIVPDALYKVGTWDNSAGASLTDDTTDAQDAGTADVPLFVVSENDDGHVIQSPYKFNIVQYVITTTANNNGTIAYTYWNGSAWTTFTPITSATFTSTGTTYVIFNSPSDWTKLAAADTPVATDGLTAGNYAIKVAATTAPSSSAATATTIKLVSLVDFLELVGDGQSIYKEYGSSGIQLPGGAILTAYSSTANAQNWINVQYAIEG